MAAASPGWNLFVPVRRLFDLLRLERKEVTSIYYYAILAGLFQLAIPLGIQAVINFVLAGTLSTSMVVLIAMVVVAVFLSGFLQVNQMKLIEKIQQRIFARYAFEFAWRIPRLDMQKVDGYYMPEFVNRFFDSVSLQKSISKLLLDIPTATLQVVFGLILLSLYANIFIIFSILTIIVIYLILYRTSAKGLTTSLEESDYKYKVAGWLEEIARVMKSFRFSRLSTLPIDKTDDYVTAYIDARTRHFKVLLVQYWALIVFKVLITASMLVVGGVLLVQNQINIGQFVAAEIVILLVLGSVEKLIQSLENIYDVLTSIEKLGKVLDKPLERFGTMPLEEGEKGLAVRMEHVDFGYNDAVKILEDISIDIQPSQKVCIMGSDGSGKSTLLRLLTGSYLEFEGSILINGIPIGNYNHDMLRAKTGILFHQQDIFNGTIYENISLGDRSVTATQIMELARKVGLESFVTTLKQGFDTEIDPMGKRLSTGVVRKILLLRALISHPRLLLLEDPWLGYDEEYQKRIMNYLLYETPEATVLVATNDEEFSRQCDHVIIMKNGKIIRQGKPADVI
jgi:ABC-type bacteriocin/lantibiotic exporter with double-glycine peptidase domain